MKTCLVTGCAGFIGFHVTRKLLELNFTVIGVDNLNEYYDIDLKISRLDILKTYKNFIFVKRNVEDSELLQSVGGLNVQIIIHLAAQAGVRYSLVNPDAYFNSNVLGTFNIIKLAKSLNCQRLIFASTSSVYGNATTLPTSEYENTNDPIQFYATTKRMNEIMIHNFALMEATPCLIFRFFTVYGPWGRPDMALFKFTKNMLEGKEIDIYNNGHHKRSFTYIDDIVFFLLKSALMSDAQIKDLVSPNFYRTFNLGNSESKTLMDYVEQIEKATGVSAKKNFLEMQRGDVLETCADNKSLLREFGDYNFTQIDVGIKKFVEWYRNYYRP